MEINRNEEVPKLVTIYELSKSKDTRNKLLMQARSQTQNYRTELNSFGTTEKKAATRHQQKNIAE
jgi:hypothetical protein